MEQKQTNLDRYNDTRMAGGYKDAPDIIPVTQPALTDFTERMSKELQMQNEIINSIQSIEEELEQANDKKRWEWFIGQLEKIEFIEMKNSTYKKKMAIAEDKISEILGL